MGSAETQEHAELPLAQHPLVRHLFPLPVLSALSLLKGPCHRFLKLGIW